VLVDYRTQDDAGVYALDERTALVQTVDFFTPIVDDAYAYGQIAAANALSDVYAMGGTPVTALSVAAFPSRDFDPALAAEIVRGGLDALRAEGVVLLGGHTVRDQEVKFGYAVTGIVDPRLVWTNVGARPGDRLLLTKPIGTGVIATAIKRGVASSVVADAAVASMRRSNAAAARVLRELAAGAVHACTDVTGFGLIGHAVEMAGPAVTLAIDVGRVPWLPGAEDLATAHTPGGGQTNREHFGRHVEDLGEADVIRGSLLFDPQTSGGLLVAIDPDVEAEALSRFDVAGLPVAQIGEVLPRERVSIRLRASR
jgi:selenide,water dikinase